MLKTTLPPVAKDMPVFCTTTGGSLTGVPVMALLPVMGAATPSLTLVAMVKLLLKLSAGVKLTPASKVLTSASAPLAVHTPVPAL